MIRYTAFMIYRLSIFSPLNSQPTLPQHGTFEVDQPSKMAKCGDPRCELVQYRAQLIHFCSLASPTLPIFYFLTFLSSDIPDSHIWLFVSRALFSLNNVYRFKIYRHTFQVWGNHVTNLTVKGSLLSVCPIRTIPPLPTGQMNLHQHTQEIGF